MAGGYIHCGTFSGSDKSGSALEGVLNSLPDEAGHIRQAIEAQLDDKQQFALIPEQQASQLLPLLLSYREQLVLQIGHEDWKRETETEERAGLDSIELKWRSGRGWKLYCATDLIGACNASLAQHEPIWITFE